MKDDCFSSSRSSKERRINAYYLMAFGTRIVEYHKTQKRWSLDLDVIRHIHTVYTAVRRANLVSTRSVDDFLPSTNEVREDTEATEVRETPEYIAEDEDDFYAVEEYDES